MTLGALGSSSHPSHFPLLDESHTRLPMPAVADAGQGIGSVGFGFGYSPVVWVRFQPVEALHEGARLRGEAFVRDRPEAGAPSRTELSGTFDALVCEPRAVPYRPLPG